MFLLKWAFIGVILLPVAEVVACFVMVLTIGWLWTLVWFLATSLAGVLVLRHAGRADLDRFRAALSAGGIRAINLDTPGLATIVGGILLVLPGFITDLLGALLFIPAVRRWIGAAIGRANKRHRAARDPSLIDLAPDEWHQVPDAIDERREGDRAHPRQRKSRR
jgi:UPF0716 protein FxsA